MNAIRAVHVFNLICIGLICIGLVCSSGSKAHAEETLPDDMVKAGLAILADAAREHGNQSESSEQGLVEAVRLFLTEYTDVSYAARLIFADYWNVASPAQQERFAAAYNSQVTNLLVQFVPDIDFGSVVIDPFQGDIEETHHMVQATFRTSDKQTIHFVLVIYEKAGRWLIFDVIAEGVSYVKTYRNQFSAEAAAVGIEATIERFEIRSGRRGNG